MSGSIKRSKAANSVGSCTVTGFRPAPRRRTRPASSSTPLWISRIPFAMALRDKPHARWTSDTPPVRLHQRLARRHQTVRPFIQHRPDRRELPPKQRVRCHPNRHLNTVSWLTLITLFINMTLASRIRRSPRSEQFRPPSKSCTSKSAATASSWLSPGRLARSTRCSLDGTARRLHWQGNRRNVSGRRWRALTNSLRQA